MKLQLTSLILSGLLLSGCQQLMTRHDVKGRSSGKAAKKIDPIIKAKTDNEIRLQEQDRQFRELMGRIEVLEHENSTLKESKAKASESEKQKALELELTLNLYKEAIEKLDKQLLLVSQEVQSLRAEKVARAKARKTRGSSKKSTKKGPWGYGEELFKKEKWKSAIISYQKYRDKNPKGKLYPTATYKIGVCFQNLGKMAEAKAFYDEVIEIDPKGRSAKKARYRLKQIK